MFLTNLHFYFLFILLFSVASSNSDLLKSGFRNASLTLERSRSMALLLSSLQCISSTDEDESIIREINSGFNPKLHINEYQNPKDVQLLLQYVDSISGSHPEKNDDPFTNTPVHIDELSLILNTLYFNTENWELFYNTSVWLIDRVNSAELFWSLMVVAGDKFSDSMVIPPAVEVFPQLFINKNEVAKVAALEGISTDTSIGEFPLQYFASDPGLNEFHTHWHIDNPFWWNETKYGVTRDRKGETFLYMHHNVITRYQAELLSNGLADPTPLELIPGYAIPEGYDPDVVNVNFQAFPLRNRGETMRDYDDGKFLATLKASQDRFKEAIQLEFLQRTDGAHESLRYENRSDIFGATMESSLKSVNVGYYGSLHNYLHRFLGLLVKPRGPIPGVQAHAETAMRDPVFFRLHKLVDNLYLDLKSRELPYTKKDLDFPGVEIKSVQIQSSTPPPVTVGPLTPSPSLPVLTTFFNIRKDDISTAARPCRGIGEPPTISETKILDHFPFNYTITLKSSRNEIGHGMARIFLLPEYDRHGQRFAIDDSQRRAIELDRFRIQLDPQEEIVLTRSSLDSSVTRPKSPGIKSLFELTPSSIGNLFQPKMIRACGFPQNLLIPKGTRSGLQFKLTVMVSEEPKPDETVPEYPNFPYCGTLNGYKFPDRRPMGFPFDRPGTRFVSFEGGWAVSGGYFYRNVKQMPIVIKHQ